MKKTIFVALTMLVSIAIFAQKKEKPPAPPPGPDAPPLYPPPPPAIDIKKFPPPPPKIQIDSFPTSGNADYQTFLKNNKTVKSIGWSDNNVVRIHLKSGKEEVYRTNVKEERQNLEAKYGKLPTPPPPPPKPKAPNEKKQS